MTRTASRSTSSRGTAHRVAAALVALLVIPVLALPAHASMSAQSCKRPTELVAGRPVRIPAKHGTIWALPIGFTPASVGTPLKLVWRVTGTGGLSVRFESPEGKRVPLSAGPTPHTGSTFVHPGAEYGTIFEFDQPGCWIIRLTRARTHATVRVSVA
jgi:hypothetical protein